MTKTMSTARPMGSVLEKTEGTARERFMADVLAGLSARPKTLPCKYFYDEHGSRLFEAICELEEYYPTRTELTIMDRHADAMVSALGQGVLLIEYGSGSSLKTRILLERITRPASYVPVDISGEPLNAAAARLTASYPDLEVVPLHADFTEPLRLPPLQQTPRRRVVYFPGSTVGNFTATASHALLTNIAHLVGHGGGLLIGTDLDKDPQILQRAYDDPGGVTAAFNLNLLARINRELDGDFDLTGFRHFAPYNRGRQRIEMFLVSTRDQLVRIGHHRFRFAEGETILTEYSHKYTLPEFAGLAAQAGFRVERVWTDERSWFAVQWLTVLR